MKTKLFISVCFYALLIFVMAIIASEGKQCIGVHEYANWLGRGTILQGGDRNECGGGNAINFLDGNKEEDNGNVVHFPGMGNVVNSPAAGNRGGGGHVIHFPGGGKGGGRGNMGGSGGNTGGNG
jgi:hypothetical protein